MFNEHIQGINKKNELMAAYILAADEAYLDKNEEGETLIYLDVTDVFKFPEGHGLKFYEIPSIFQDWSDAQRHKPIDVNVSDETLSMMIELCVAEVAFFNRYSCESGLHDGPVQH